MRLKSFEAVRGRFVFIVCYQRAKDCSFGCNSFSRVYISVFVSNPGPPIIDITQNFHIWRSSLVIFNRKRSLMGLLITWTLRIFPEAEYSYKQ